MLAKLWKRLEETFKVPSLELQALLHGRRVLLLCYDGDSARVATSVLRAKGHEADSVRGGFRALRRLREKSDRDSCAGGVINGDTLPVFSSNPIGVPAQVV